MAENMYTNSTQTITLNQEINPQPLTLVLRNPNERSRRQLQWAEGTVDNEHMGKKKSKCCCIYERPKQFDESSSSSSESEYDIDCCSDLHGHKVYKLHKKKDVSKVSTENCRGHTKDCYNKKNDPKQSTEYPVVVDYDFQKDNDGDSPPHSPKDFEI